MDMNERCWSRETKVKGSASKPTCVASPGDVLLSHEHSLALLVLNNE